MSSDAKKITRTLELHYPVNYTEVYDSMLVTLDKETFTPDDRFALELVLDEAITNAVKHGNGNDPDKKVTVKFTSTPQRFEVEITDEGPGFDYNALPNPTCEENLLKPSGRGVLLMNAYMDEVVFNEKGNSVRLVKLAGNYKKKKGKHAKSGSSRAKHKP